MKTYIIWIVVPMLLVKGQDFYFPDNDVLQRFPQYQPNNDYYNNNNKQFRNQPTTSQQRPSTPINNELVPMVVPPSMIYNPFAPIRNASEIISDGINSLGLKLNEQFYIGNGRAEYNQKPIVFSPFNIAEALSLVLLGSVGRTYTEIAQALGLSNSNLIQNSQQFHEQFGRLLQEFESNTNKDSPKLTAASGVFVQNGFPIRNEYKQIATTLYKSEIHNLNFLRNSNAAKNFINNWISQKTNGIITDLLSSPPPTKTRVILASALYFKGAWQTPFMPEQTDRRRFYPYGRSNPTSVLVDLMFTTGKFMFYNSSTLKCEILELPYKGGTTSMYIIKPTLSTVETLRQLESQLTPTMIDQLIGQMRERSAIVALPKMKLEATVELQGVLSNMGVRTLFNPMAADLGVLSPGMTNQINSGLGSRFGKPDNQKYKTNCSKIFDLRYNSISNCTDSLPKPINNHTKVIYKRFGNQIGRRFARNYIITSYNIRRYRRQLRSIDELRRSIENDPNSINPQLHAETILHKVFINVDEIGTEAAAATDIISDRRKMLTVRLDSPFLLFIRHKPTKVNLFWGSITVPTPNYT